MRDILSEYGMLIITVIGAIFAFAIYTFISSHYKEFSKNFVGCITGSYVEYNDDIPLEEIEEGLF